MSASLGDSLKRHLDDALKRHLDVTLTTLAPTFACEVASEAAECEHDDKRRDQSTADTLFVVG